MPSIFTRIIEGEIPGKFVWQDDTCVAFMDVRPLHPGHVLVVPRTEIDHWLDLEADVAAHLMAVAHHVGNAQQGVVPCLRIGLMIAGFEVPHVHVHVVPVDGMADLDFGNADASPDPAELDRLADAIRAALREQGHGAQVPGSDG